MTEDNYLYNRPHEVGFAAMCKLLGGDFEEDGKLLRCEIPLHSQVFDPSDVLTGPPRVGTLYMEIGITQTDKRNLRVWYEDANQGTTVFFGNYDVGVAENRLVYTCNVNKRGTNVDVSCWSANNKFSIRTRRFPVGVDGNSEQGDEPEEVSEFVYEIGIGPTSANSIGNRPDKYTWVIGTIPRCVVDEHGNCRKNKLYSRLYGD